MNAYVVRPICSNDVPAFNKLVAEDPIIEHYINFTSRELEDEGEEPTGYYIGIFDNQDLVGVCTVGYADALGPSWTNDCLLSDVYIQSSREGHGLGSILVREAIKLAKATYPEAKYLYAEILLDYLFGWYQRLGFEISTEMYGVRYTLNPDK